MCEVDECHGIIRCESPYTIFPHISFGFFSAMDRHKIQTNRRKTQQQYISGSAKRKIAEEKREKNDQVIAKSRRMTDFIIVDREAVSAENNVSSDDTYELPNSSHSQAEGIGSDNLVSGLEINNTGSVNNVNYDDHLSRNFWHSLFSRGFELLENK